MAVGLQGDIIKYYLCIEFRFSSITQTKLLSLLLLLTVLLLLVLYRRMTRASYHTTANVAIFIVTPFCTISWHPQTKLSYHCHCRYHRCSLCYIVASSKQATITATAAIIVGQPVPIGHPSESHIRPLTTLFTLGQHAAVGEYQ